MPIREIDVKKEIGSVARFISANGFGSKYVHVNPAHVVKEYTRLADAGMVNVFVLEDNDGNLQGGIGFINCFDFHNGEKIGIETFWYVAPQYRGEGMKLIKTFENKAKELGCVKAAMIHMVDSMPDVLRRVYGRRGYKLIECHYVKDLNEA